MDEIPYTLRQLEVFDQVARTGSIAGAAVTLHCSPSAVASALDQLEKALGSTLVRRRRSRGVTLTASGLQLHRAVPALLDAARQVAGTVGQDPDRLTGLIRLGAYDALAAATLPRLLAGFTRRHPAVEFTLHGGDQDRIRDLLGHGELDVAVTYNEFITGDVRFTRVQRRYPYALLPAAHPLATRDTVSLRELADHPLILLDSPPSKANTLSWFESAGVTPRIRWSTSVPALARSLVGQGLGYTLMLQPYAHDLTTDGARVGLVPVRPRPAPSDVFVVWRHGHDDGAAHLRRFVEFAVRELTEEEGDVGGRGTDTSTGIDTGTGTDVGPGSGA